MPAQRGFFVALFSLCVFATACRIPKDDIPGEYYLVSPGGSESDESLALDLKDDGSFTLYRSFYTDANAPGNVQIVGNPNEIHEHSGSGTWELLNQTILGPGEETVMFKGEGGGEFYQDGMSTTRKDGRVCLYTSGRKEYWCKKN
jgi:hypothetical protein